jgi:hypothetical protein
MPLPPGLNYPPQIPSPTAGLGVISGVGMFAITPNDTIGNQGRWARRLFVTTGGTLTAIGWNGETFVVTVPNNFYLDVIVGQVLAAGTGASGIFGIL